MALAENFRRQVDLLLRTVPFIAKETCFALKGGTAINLFCRGCRSTSTSPTFTSFLEPSRSGRSTRP